MLSLSNKLSLTTQPVYKFVNEYSIDFDGVDDRIITDGEVVQYQHATYSFWCKSSETGQNAGVFGHGGLTVGSFNFNYSSNKPSLFLNGSNFYRYWDDTSAQDDGEWHHWIVYVDINDITNCKLYVDGVLQNPSTTVSTGSANPYTESLTIGSDQASGGNSFVGKIDEFAVYDRELTQAEITRMYNTYYSPNRVANGNFAQIGNEEVTNGDFSQIGSEQITNGDFATDSDWNKGSGITISGGSANFTGVANANINQNAGLVTGKIYKIVFTVSNYVSGDIDYNIGGATRRGAIAANGTYTDYVESSSGQIFYFQSDQTNGFVGSIENVSIKEVGQDWTFNTGWSTDGTKAISDTGSGYININQTTSIAINKSYKVSFTVSDYSSGNVQFIIGNSGFRPSGVLRSANGTYTEYITVDSSTVDADKFFIRGGASGFSGSVDNISVKEVGQHWTFGTDWKFDGDKPFRDTTGLSPLYQSAGLIIGRTYKVTFDLVSVTASGIRPYVGGAGTGTLRTSVGTYSENIVCAGNNVFYMQQENDFIGSIDNIVLQELKHDATNLMLNAGDYQSANPLITSTKSMEFDGVDTTLEANNELSSGTYSFSAWVKRDTIPSSWQYIIDFRRGNTSSQYVAYNASGGFGTGTGSDIVYVDGVTSSTAPNDTKWHHIVVTGLSIANNSKINIGSRYTGLEAMDGKITEVGLWDRTLTALEVASLYNQGVPTNLLVNRNNYQSGNPTVFNTKQVDFDGTDDKLVFNTPSAFSGLGLNSFDCTLSAWAKFDTIGQYEAIVCLGTFDLEIAPLNATDVGIWVDNAGLSTTYTPTMGEWNHYVATKSGNTYSLYVDGVLIGSDTDSDNATIGTQSFIGNNGASNYFDGDISQVGIWNEALTANEVSSLYNHGLPIDLTTDQAAYSSSSNLVGYWRMGSGTLDTYPLIADQTNATLGSELVTNGDFATDLSGWSNANNHWQWTSQGAYFPETTTHNPLSQVLSNDANAILKLTFTLNIVKGTANVFYIDTGSAAVSTQYTTSGTYTIYTVNAGANTSINFSRYGGINTEFYLDNVSVKQVQGNPAIMTNQTSSDIENGSPYANLVQNGTFDTDSNWAKGTGWSIANGLASCDGSQSSTTLLYQNSGSLSGKTVNISFTLSNYSAGHLTTAFFSASGTLNQQVSANGDYSFDIYIESGHNGNTGFTANSSFIGSIDNVTISEVNTGLQGYWKMGDGTNDEYPYIFDQTNPTYSNDLISTLQNGRTSGINAFEEFTDNGGGSYTFGSTSTNWAGTEQPDADRFAIEVGEIYKFTFDYTLNSGSSSFGLSIGNTAVGSSYAGGYYYPSYNGSHTVYFTIQTANSSSRIISQTNAIQNFTISNLVLQKLEGNIATMTNMVEGNITNQYPLTKIRNYYRMGDGILDGYPLIADQTNPSLGSELVPSIASIVNAGGGTITQISGNSYSSTSDSTSGSAVRPKFDFATTSGKTYKLVITPTGTITGTVNFDFYDGSNYLFSNYDFTTTKEIYFTDNGNVFGAFDGTQTYNITGFTISIKQVNGNPGTMTNMSASDIVEDTPNEPN